MINEIKIIISKSRRVIQLKFKQKSKIQKKNKLMSYFNYNRLKF